MCIYQVDEQFFLVHAQSCIFLLTCMIRVRPCVYPCVCFLEKNRVPRSRKIQDGWWNNWMEEG